MRHRLCLATISILAVFATIGPVYAHPALGGRVISLHIGTTTRVLDMTPIGSTFPPEWMAGAFDDASWDRVTTVPVNVLYCASSATGLSGWRPRRAYWGGVQGDSYLFRQSARLSKAHDYYGSEITFTGAVRAFALFINGHQLTYKSAPTTRDRGFTARYALTSYLHAGVNVIGVYAVPSHRACNAIDVSATLRMAGI